MKISFRVRSPLGNLEGIRLPGYFETIRTLYLDSFLETIGY